MDQHPELLPRFLSEPVDEPADEPAALRQIAEAKLRASGRHVCSYAFGLQQQLAFVHNALLATGSGKKTPEHFVGEAIREAVTHEVGHTLGLRHNFKASSWLTLEEIRRRRNEGDEPTSASVMDYNPLLFFAGDDPEKVRHFVTPTIGPWDYWVIEYGHRVPEKGKSEKEMLEEVASRCAEKGLDYATDEDTMWVFSPDPLTNRYDNSSDLVAWARSRIELCDRLTENIADWAIRKGESRYHVRQAFDQVWFEKGRNFEYVTRLVGGQYFHRDHKGDPDARPPFVLVDAETQRAALNLLKETLLTDTFFKFDPALLNQLAPSRWSHWGSRTSLELDYPIHDRIVGLQLVGLFDLLTPPVLQRVYDAELKSDDPNRFTAAELIRTLRDHIWSSAYEVGEGPYTDAKPFISSITRNLQQGYLDLMLIHAQARLGANFSLDLYVMIRSSLRELSDRIGQTLERAGSKLDFASRGHLVECKSRIDRVLEAQFSAR
ncbi:MAG TPA: zinc-dependent metalloprotease [Phycisphaerae bacterium]|nr:zinc-dependent metalloprotease [Phycisphaerae bacterium]